MRGREGILRRTSAMAIERIERHWALMPPEVARRVRPRVARFDDGIATLMAGSDALRVNRVVGLGHRGRARPETLDAILEHYRAAGVRRFAVEISPGPQRAEIEGWLARRGFARRGGYTLLLRDVRRPIPPLPRDVRVTRAGRGEAAQVVRILASAFPIPPSRRAWSLAGVTAPGMEHYLARVGDRPVAVGALRMRGDLAWLGGAATLTRWRRRGAHGALIVARLRRAARSGCRWAWVETTHPAPGRPGGSRRNLLRLGFEEACHKPIYVRG